MNKPRMSFNVLEPPRGSVKHHTDYMAVDLWRREILQMCAAHSPPGRFTVKTEMVHIELLHKMLCCVGWHDEDTNL
jgi:hypothetical protein